ncbi:MAG: trigger factor [Deltaproteobacteria bacterium RBG_13_58_19]|nr:MAG: trigger factor [Deltaproteobacteria bacterium RBG_13_58_19]
MTERPIKVEVENLSEVKRKLEIVVPSAEVTQEVDRAYRDLGKRVKVKGFRPGKIPRSVLELYYRRQVEQEVSDTLARRSLGEALKEKALEPVGLNWPDPLPQLVADAEFRFSVELEVAPEFTVADYLGLTLTDPGAEVTEEMVAARLEEIRQANAVLQPVADPRPIQEGDFVVLSYQGYFAGQALAEGKAENTYMEIGAGKFNLEFERQLLGLLPGADTRFSVALPPDFFNPLMAGKVVEFQVQIQEIKEKVVPEWDDAFAQSLGGNFQTLADLQGAVREDIIKGKERDRQTRLEQQVLDQLLAAQSFEAPPSLIRQEQENILREQFERLVQHGVNLAGLDQGKMLESVRPNAERRVRVRLLLERLAAQEGVSIAADELEAGLERLAERSGRDLAQVRQFYQEHDLMEVLRRQLGDEKIMKLLLDKANLVTAAATEAEESP